MRSALTFLTLSWSICVSAQLGKTYPMQDALTHFQSQGINFSYDPELVSMTSIDFDYLNRDLESFIHYLSEKTPFSAQFIQDGYYAVLVNEVPFSLKVVDSTSWETIDPASVIVLINDIPFSIRQESSKLIFDYKPKKGDVLSVFVFGYQSTVVPATSLLSERDLVVAVNPQVHELESVVIQDYLTKGINMEPSSQSIKISVSDLPLLPGETDGDLFASLVALPGVTTPDNRPGNLFIRGSSTDQSFILFDGIPIYHRGHYYGTISPYNPKMVGNVSVYRNGFHPRYGGRVGGGVEINSEDQIKSESKAGLGTNTLYGMGYAKIPVLKNKLGLAVSARRSFPVSFHSPKLEAISKMVFAGSAVIDSTGSLPEKFEVLFQDFNARAELALNPANRISLSAIFAETVIDYDIEGARLPEHNDYQNYGLNLKWKRTINKTWSSTSTVTGSSYNFLFTTTDPSAPNAPPVNKNDNGVRDLNISQELGAKFSNGNSLQLGAEFKNQRVHYLYRAGRGGSGPVEIAELVEGNSVSAFTNFQLNTLPRVYLEAGARVTYYSPLKTVNPEPRVSFNYELTKNAILKGAAGIYYQYLSQAKLLEFTSGGFDNEVWLLASSKTAKIVKGNQSMMGAIWSSGSWIIDLELYYKEANNVTYSKYRKLNDGVGWTTADQIMKGVDFLLKKQFGEKMSVWAGYSLSNIIVRMDTSDIAYFSKYSQPSYLYVGGNYIKGNVKVSAGWKYASGLYTKSLDILESQNAFLRGAPNNPLATENPFADLPLRYEPIHMLDLSISYMLPKKPKRPFESTFGLSLLNLYNQLNLTDQVVRSGTGIPDFQKRNAMKFAPNLMILVEF